MAVNCAAPVLVFCTVQVAEAIVFEASLSFIGAGVRPPDPSWGSVIADGKNMVLTGGWWATVFPGLLMLITVLSERYEAAEKFINPIQYLVVPISGFLFLVDWLPNDAQRMIWYMPMTHCFEVIRAGFFGSAIQPHYDIAVPLTVSLVLVFLFLPKLEGTRDYLKSG